MSNRFIAINVLMPEHPIVGFEKPFARSEAWQWLLINAAWKDKRVAHKGKALLLKRGDVLAGRSYLAEQWGWGEQRVRTFVHKLVSEGMIQLNQSDGHYANVVNICNYNKYQPTKTADNQNSNQSPTRAQPEPNQTFTCSTTSTTAAAASAGMRETVSDDVLERKLLDACNGALANPVNAIGLLNLSVPKSWLEQGADLETEIIPVLKAAGKKYHGKQIRDWSYFTPIIVDARAKRAKGGSIGADPDEARRAAAIRKINIIAGLS